MKLNPYWTHPLVAAIETLVLFAMLHFGLPALGVHSIPVFVFCVVLPAVIVSTFYYGREAGQREHDLKHATPPSGEVAAFFKAEYALGWSIDNWLQWLVAAAATVFVALVLFFLLG